TPGGRAPGGDTATPGASSAPQRASAGPRPRVPPRSRGTEHWSGTGMAKHCNVCNRSYPDHEPSCPYCADVVDIIPGPDPAPGWRPPIGHEPPGRGSAMAPSGPGSPPGSDSGIRWTAPPSPAETPSDIVVVDDPVVQFGSGSATGLPAQGKPGDKPADKPGEGPPSGDVLEVLTAAEEPPAGGAGPPTPRP